MRVLKDGKVIKEADCSTGELGNSDTETPLGTFDIQSKGEYFFSNKYQEGARYYIKFFSNYLIHSIPVDKKGNIIEEEKVKIGTPVSHGCIRIAMADSKWVYDNIPQGSQIMIHY
jgi:lipoprotein-anchoring transpeptidase ErfK/SrfK